MLAILSAPGSRGDVNPMVAIGKQLRKQGFDVVISLAQPYAGIAEAAGLQVEPVISRERFDEMLGDPVVWKPIRGVRRILNQVASEFLTMHDDVIRKHHRPGETVLVAHPLDFASRVFREQNESTPLVDIHLAPATLRAPSAPARLTPWWFELSGPIWGVKASYWIADHLILDPALRPSLGALRQRYGLPKVTRYLDHWWHSPDRIIGLFPKWFAPETMTVSDKMGLVGFPLDDGIHQSQAHRHHASSEFLVAGQARPVVFTAGTAHRHSRAFFESAVAVCRQLDQPGLLLSTHRDNIPKSLPANVAYVDYVPMGQLLGKAAAIVHHGGIGTASQAFAAGIPQIIRPNAFDQFDNATRVQRLNCGAWMKRDRALADTISDVLSNQSIVKDCREIARRIAGEPESGAIAAANEIARLRQSWN